MFPTTGCDVQRWMLFCAPLKYSLLLVLYLFACLRRYRRRRCTVESGRSVVISLYHFTNWPNVRYAEEIHLTLFYVFTSNCGTVGQVCGGWLRWRINKLALAYLTKATFTQSQTNKYRKPYGNLNQKKNYSNHHHHCHHDISQQVEKI